MINLSVRLPARELTLDDVADMAERDPDHRYELREGNLSRSPADAEMAARVGNSGRSPDIVVLAAPGSGRTVWIEPSDVRLAIEIVPPGSVPRGTALLEDLLIGPVPHLIAAG